MALRKNGLSSGLLPAFLAAKVTARANLVKICPLLMSLEPLSLLIVAHLECPLIVQYYAKSINIDNSVTFKKPLTRPGSLFNLVSMVSLSPSLFIKEPGRTKNLKITSPQLKKEARALKPGDLLEVKISDGKVSFYSLVSGRLVAEVGEEKIAKKINFTLNNKGEVLAIFVSLLKGFKSPSLGAQFLIKSSMPIFNDENLNADVKPFVRSGTTPAEEEEAEIETETEDSADDRTHKSETDPLAGLTIINKEDLPNQPEE